MVLRKELCVLLVVVSLVCDWVQGQGTNSNETQAREFLQRYNDAAADIGNKLTQTQWNQDANLTDDNQAQLVRYQVIYARFQKDARTEALTFNDTGMSYDVSRQLRKIRDIGVSAQPDASKIKEIATLVSQMESIYGKAKVCVTPENCLSLDPDITRVLASSRDYDTLLTLWTGWRNETGRKMKDLYTRFVQLNNEAVKFSGYNNTGEMWRSEFESDTFVKDIQDLFKQIQPLYEHLHAFVRRRLKQVYGETRFPASGHIPAHLLGNMWAQEWNNVAELLKPFENTTSLDVTKELVRQNYTANRIFRTAEDFFVSLGFDPMVASFWSLSLLEKPTDGRELVCHPSSWDFLTQKDFRIKMCTDITQRDFLVVHDLVSDIQYFMQYRNQPVIYREGANPAFHYGVGDAIDLLVQTPEHMKRLGLITEIQDDKEADINFLLNMALQKIAFLPFGYLIDQWRWSVFGGDTTPATYNRDWWNLRCRLQGVSPPVQRSEDDFDPGAKYHMPANVPYIQYFVSYIIQFQFHQAACQAAGHVGPLHKCDIYNNKEAGQKLRDMMQLGSSKPWPEAMKQLTGQDKMSAQPLLEYFQPLLDYLRQENGDDHGWSSNCPTDV